MVKIMIGLLDAGVIEKLAKLWRLVRSTFFARSHEGMYEVLHYDATLQLMDTKGKRAVYRKFQRVKFNQNNIIAFQDQAWGDGNIFADYKCTPGYPVDRYKEGHRHIVLISLREVKQRGEITDFQIERTIEDGFMDTTEVFQAEINHVMHHFSFSVIFPKVRPPKSVMLIKQNLQQTIRLGPECFSTLPDGNVQVQWTTDKPMLFEAYILRWEW